MSWSKLRPDVSAVEELGFLRLRGVLRWTADTGPRRPRLVGDYLLTIVHRSSGESVLVSSLHFTAAPKVPPLLAWSGDVIVATDLTGSTSTPTVQVRLTR